MSFEPAFSLPEILLEPDIRDPASVPRQIFETSKAVKALERNIGYVLRLREAEIDGDPRSPIRLGLQAAPTDKIPANAAEIEGNRSRVAGVGGKRSLRIFDMDAVAVIVVCPKHAIAAADRAVADGGVRDLASKNPTHRAAMALSSHL
jgi:hypothetical protein